MNGPSRIENFELTQEFPHLGFRSIVVNARQMQRTSAGRPVVLVAIDDVTDRRRSDLARLAAARDEERRRVARELHDDLVQRLASLAMELGSYAAKPRLGSTRLANQLRDLQKQVVEAANVGRRLAHTLHPSEADDLGLESAIRAFCEDLREKSGIAVKFVSRNVPERLHRELASCLYRVVQESLRNVAKHATRGRKSRSK